MSKVTKGVAWSAVERFSTQGVGFCISIILARLIAPDSYGLVVMIQVFMSFSQLFVDSGFSNALMQKKDRTETDYYTVFIFNFTVSCALYMLLFLGAPLIADFYNRPQLSLLTRIVALNLIINSLSIVQRTRLSISLDFKTQSKASLLSVIFSGIIGIILAYSGYEVWALVFQSLCLSVLNTILLMCYSHWVPRLIFSKSSFKQLFSFGSKLLAGNILTSIYLNIYNLTIGKFYNTASLAYYNKAFTLSQFPSVNIDSIIQRIVYPVLCELQDNRERLVSQYFKFVHASNVLVFGLMTLLCVLAKPLILVLLTKRWLPCAEYLSIYCINFSVFCWLSQSVSLVLSIGQSGAMLKASLYKRIISFVILIVTIPMGIRIICIGICLNTFIELIISLYYCQKYVGIQMIDQFQNMLLPIANCIITSLAVCIVLYIFDNPYVQLFLGGFIGLVSYISIIFVFKFDERQLICNIITKVKQRK